MNSKTTNRLFAFVYTSPIILIPFSLLFSLSSYAYPSYFTEELVEEIASNPKVCMYR